MIAAGNRIAHKPYKYGGGHGSFSDSGYDCSGSVSFALHGGGLLDVPMDSSQLDVLRRSGQGPLHHDLLAAVTRLHGRARPALRHLGRRRRRLALAVGPALVSGLHRAASSWSLTSIAAAQALFEAEGTYLNTASYGLPPRTAFDALQQALGDWRHGRTSWEGWNAEADRARAPFARLVGADPAHVTVGASASGLVGLVAASLPAGTRVVVPDIEFTSVLFPFMAQPGLEVTTVPLARLAEAIDETVDVAAFSVVQMSTGEVADLDAILAAAAAHDVITVADASQAAGWLPLDATRFGFLARRRLQVAALAARDGVDDGRARAPRRDRARPTRAGSRAASPTTRSSARRCGWRTTRAGSTTPPPGSRGSARCRRWSCSTRSAIEAIHAHDVGLANRFRAGMGMEPGDSAIVTLDGDLARLRAAGVQAAKPGGTRESRIPPLQRRGGRRPGGRRPPKSQVGV